MNLVENTRRSPAESPKRPAARWNARPRCSRP